MTPDVETFDCVGVKRLVRRTDGNIESMLERIRDVVTAGSGHDL